jgi:hypothetical protein
MSGLMPARPVSGEIVTLGAAEHMHSELDQMFQERGQLAAELVLAALTESDYRPQIGGIILERPLFNPNCRTEPTEENPEGQLIDTVYRAAGALAEAQNATVPGARPLRLGRVATRYGWIWHSLAPSRQDGGSLADEFDTALLGSLEQQNIPLSTRHDVQRVLYKAPPSLRVMTLKDRPEGSHNFNNYELPGLTADGRLINLVSRGAIAFVPIRLALPKEISKRGGTAPDLGMPAKVIERVADLRTRHAAPNKKA